MNKYKYLLCFVLALGCGRNSDNLMATAEQGGQSSDVEEKFATITAAGFTPDGKAVIFGLLDGTLRVVTNLKEKASETVYNCHGESGIRAVSVHKSRPLVLTGAQDGSSVLFDYKAGRQVAKFTICRGKWVTGIEWVGDNQFVAVGDFGVQFWDIEANSPRHMIAPPKEAGGFMSVRFLPETDSIAIGCTNGQVAIVDRNRKTMSPLIGCHDGLIWQLRSGESERKLITCSVDTTAKVLDIQARAVKDAASGASPILSVVVIKKSSLILTGAADGKMVATNASRCEVLNEKVLPGPIAVLEVSPDESLVVAAGARNMVCVFDAAKLKKIQQFQLGVNGAGGS